MDHTNKLNESKSIIIEDDVLEVRDVMDVVILEDHDKEIIGLIKPDIIMDSDDTKSLHIDLEINNNDESMDLDWNVTNLDVIQSILIDDEDEDEDEDEEEDENNDDNDEMEDEMEDEMKDEMEDEIENDCYVFLSIVKQQMDTRTLIFKQNLKNYIKQYISTHDIKTKKHIVKGIHKMGGCLSLGCSIGAILTDILFTDQILNEYQIKKYEQLIVPFLNNQTTRENFLNQILIVFDKYYQLIEPETVSSVFENLLEYGYIDTSSLIYWYDSLTDINLSNDLKIKSSTVDAINSFLEDVIRNE
jgi:hypothetical protein